MSVKKYFGLAAAGVAFLVATSAMAGGPDVMVAPAPDYSGFYIDAGVGYGRSNWQDFVGGVFLPAGLAATPGGVTSGGTGGFTWGGDVGYQFNQYFSVEMGAYDLRSVEGNFGFAVSRFSQDATSPGAVKVSSWLLYAAGKLAIPFFLQNLDWFGKVGVAWRFLSYSGRALGVFDPLALQPFGVGFDDAHYATVIFGTGFQYWFTPEWSMTVQYLHVPGRSNFQDAPQQSPNADLFLVNGGYKFST